MNSVNLEITNEIWKPVKDYEKRYLISNYGNVKSLTRNKILKQELRRHYNSVQLYNGYKFKHFSIHRLIAITFIPNPDNLLFVNRKDENKMNNNVSNLEWCTASYNINYGTCIKRAVEKKRIAVIKLNKNGEILEQYKSCMDAERDTKIPNGNIIKCCKNERKTAGKFIWRYA